MNLKKGLKGSLKKDLLNLNIIEYKAT